MERRKTRGILLLGSALWCLMIVAAPLLHAQPIYQFFSIICHQIPSRSWVLAGSPLPVCIRCTCIYLGFFIGAVFSIRPRTDLFKVAIAVTLAEFVFARLVLDTAWLRGPSGLFLGIEAAPFVALGIEEMLEVRFRREAM